MRDPHVPEGAEELHYPTPESYVVPASELNLRGVKEWSPADKFVNRTAVAGADPNVEPQAQQRARVIENPPPRIPYQEDPRIAQVRAEQRQRGQAAVASQPMRSSPVEPSTGQPLSPADYFRQEVVPTILGGKETTNGRGY